MQPAPAMAVGSLVYLHNRRWLLGVILLVAILVTAIWIKRSGRPNAILTAAGRFGGNNSPPQRSRLRGGDLFPYSRPGFCSFAERRDVISAGCRSPRGEEQESRARTTGAPLVDVTVDHQRGVLLCQQYPVSIKGIDRYFPGLKLDTSAELSSIGFHDVPSADLGRLAGFVRITEIDPRDVMVRYGNFSKVVFMMHPLQRLVSIYERRSQKQSGVNSDVVGFMNDVTNGRTADSELLPIADRCRPCVVEYDHVVKMESFGLDLERLNKDLGFPYGALATEYVLTTENIMKNFKYDNVLRELEDSQPALFAKMKSLYDLDMDMFGYAWNESHSDCVHGNNDCC